MSEIEEKIQSVIASDVRPNIEMHGGGIEFVDFNEENGLLTISLTGVCGGCPHAQATVRNMVEGVIQQSVPEVKMVERV